MKEPKNGNNKRILTLLIVGIMAMVVSIPIYPVFQEPICRNTFALHHASCQLDVLLCSAFLFLTGLILIIASTVTISKNKKTQSTPRNATFIILTTIRWLIAIAIGMVGLVEIFASHQILFCILGLVLLGIAILLALWPKIKSKLKSRR